MMDSKQIKTMSTKVVNDTAKKLVEPETGNRAARRKEKALKKKKRRRAA